MTRLQVHLHPTTLAGIKASDERFVSGTVRFLTVQQQKVPAVITTIDS